jgi:hypothetical protein
MHRNETRTPHQALPRPAKTLAILFCVMTVLVATHEGEFWPFSIYPMFSQAGRPWSRAVVRDYTEVADSLIWRAGPIELLAGKPFALRDHDIEGPDVANFVVKNKDWSLDGQKSFRKIFMAHLEDRRLMLFRVDGRVDDGMFDVRATPVLLMSRDTTMVNPALSTE